jgi:hypothetical protein
MEVGEFGVRSYMCGGCGLPGLTRSDTQIYHNFTCASIARKEESVPEPPPRAPRRPHCSNCGKVVVTASTDDPNLCYDCWRKANLLSHPLPTTTTSLNQPELHRPIIAVLPAFQLGPPCPLGPDWTTHRLDQSQGVRTHPRRSQPADAATARASLLRWQNHTPDSQPHGRRCVTARLSLEEFPQVLTRTLLKLAGKAITIPDPAHTRHSPSSQCQRLLLTPASREAVWPIVSQVKP